MVMNTMTLPKKGLKTRHYSKDMNERDLKKYDYNIYIYGNGERRSQETL